MTTCRAMLSLLRKGMAGTEKRAPPRREHVRVPSPQRGQTALKGFRDGGSVFQCAADLRNGDVFRQAARVVRMAMASSSRTIGFMMNLLMPISMAFDSEIISL